MPAARYLLDLAPDDLDVVEASAAIVVQHKFRARHGGVPVYLEPGEAIALNTGVLVASVLDMVHNEVDIAILDTSATAHMPDALEMPYRPDLTLETRPGDFSSFLIDLAGRQGHGVGLVYSYSSLHYFSSGELEDIFHRVKLLLEPGRGLFAFGIKGEGSIWDGQGVPLYRPDVWINCDGQSRWFPSREAIVALTDRMGFELRLHEWYEHWGYSEEGEKDLFHYVICSPRR